MGPRLEPDQLLLVLVLAAAILLLTLGRAFRHF
jgi:hypothetical protein